MNDIQSMLEYPYRQTFGQNEEEKQLRAVVPGEGSAELLQLQHVADLADTGRRHPFAGTFQGSDPGI